jgi:hypothetical protein
MPAIVGNVLRAAPHRETPTQHVAWHLEQSREAGRWKTRPHSRKTLVIDRLSSFFGCSIDEYQSEEVPGKPLRATAKSAARLSGMAPPADKQSRV